MKPHRGILILIFGILSIVMCPPLGIFAWIMGGRDLKEMNNGTMDATGRGKTTGGYACGIIGTVLMVLWVVIAVIVLGLGVWVSGQPRSMPQYKGVTVPPPDEMNLKVDLTPVPSPQPDQQPAGAQK